MAAMVRMDTYRQVPLVVHHNVMRLTVRKIGHHSLEMTFLLADGNVTMKDTLQRSLLVVGRCRGKEVHVDKWRCLILMAILDIYKFIAC